MATTGIHPPGGALRERRLLRVLLMIASVLVAGLLAFALR